MLDSPMGPPPSAPLDRTAFKSRFDAMVNNIGQVVRGKDEVIRLALVAMLADGNVLLEDVPGTGKTLMARAIARTMGAEVGRIQCTPDLLPGDVTGSPTLDRRTGDFVFRPGPVFTNVLVCDEINRATPKTQSALLEAMQERNVTVDGITHPLPRPFFVLATQNPIELAGTFPLPEAQLDRFMFKLSIGYPDRLAEAEVLTTNRGHESVAELPTLLSADQVVELIHWAAQVTVSEAVSLYTVDLVQATRRDPSVQLGGSTRASIALHRAAKVLAASQGRDDVIPDDIKRLAMPVLSHRVILTPDSELREESVEQVITRVLMSVDVHMGGVSRGR